MAKRVKAPLLRRSWPHHLGSTRTLVTFLRPWIKRFTMIISAWWLRTSSEFSAKKQNVNRKVRNTVNPYAGADSSKIKAPPSHSCEWRTNMDQLNSRTFVTCHHIQQLCRPGQRYLRIAHTTKIVCLHQISEILLFTLMMKSVDFETRECSRDRELRLTCVTRGWNDYPFRRGDSIKVLSNEVEL